MEALFLVIILGSGFMFTSRYPIARFKQLRTRDWNQYLHIFVWGLPFAVFSLFLIELIYWLGDIDDYVESYWVGTEISDVFSLYVFLWGVFSFCSAWLLGYIFSKIQSFSDNATLNCAEENPLKTTMYKASKTGDLVQITLSNRKVYIGLIILVSDFKSPETKFIKICPFLSGFRDSDYLTMYITNNYMDNYSHIFKKLGIDEESSVKDFVKKHPSLMKKLLQKLDPFTNIIPIENIVSLAYFDPKVYNITNDNESVTEPKNTFNYL